MRQLLERGASSNVVDQRGQTCLHIAVLLDSTTCLRLLLQQSRHLNINAVSYDGQCVSRMFAAIILGIYPGGG